MASELIVQTLKGPTSGANANKVIIPSGQTLEINEGVALPSGTTLPAGVGGKLLQVVNTRSTTEDLASTTAVYPVASGFKLSITPSSVSSKILVIFDLDTWIDQNSNANKIGKYGIRLNSQSNTLVSEKRISIRYYAGATNADYGSQTTMTYLDSPNSTSPQEYEAVLGRWSNTYPNRVSINGGGFGHSAITLMEIAG